MGVLDRSLRAFVIAPVAIAVAFIVGAGSVVGVVLFALPRLVISVTSH